MTFRSRLLVFLLAVSLSAFGLTTIAHDVVDNATRPAAQTTQPRPVDLNHLPKDVQARFEKNLQARLDALPAPQRAQLMSTVSIGGADGISIHANIDWHGVVHEGITFQPRLVAKIWYYIQSHPYQTALEGVLIGASACIWFSVTFLAGLVCSALFAAFTTYTLDQLRTAWFYGVCLSVKIRFSLFQTPDLFHPIWDSFPYADFGSWCDKGKYVWPPGRTYNGDPSPGCLPYPQCTV